MAIIALRLDPGIFSNNALMPLDVELAVMTLDIFYLICLESKEYAIEIQLIKFESPLNIVAMLKNVSLSVAEKFYCIVSFHRQEIERRNIQNELLREDVIKKKIENIESARILRNKLIKDGLSKEEAAEELAKIISSHGSQLDVRGQGQAILSGW